MSATAPVEQPSELDPEAASRRERSAYSAVPLNAAAYVLSFLNSVVVGRLFGATAGTDAYFLAIVIPNMLVAILGASFATALQAVLAGRKLGSATRRRTRLLAMAPAATLHVLALLQWVLPGVGVIALLGGTGSPQVSVLAGRWLPIVAVAAGFQANSQVLAGAMQASGRYTAAAAHPVVGNALQMVILLSASRFGPAILPWAFLAAQTAAVLTALTFTRRGEAAAVDEPRAERLPAAAILAILLPLVGPIVFGAILSTLTTVLQRSLAAKLPAGALSAFSFACSLGMIPHLLFSVLLGGPAMTEIAMRSGNEMEVTRQLRWFLAITAGLVVPLGVGFITCAPDLMTLLYGPRLGTHAAQAAGVLRILGATMIALVPSLTFNKGFVGCGDTRTPMRWTVVSIAVAVASMYPLLEALDVRGLALAYLLQITVYSGMLTLSAARRWKGVLAGFLPAGGILVACGAGAFALFGLARWLLPDATLPGRLVRSTAAFGGAEVGLLVFAAALPAGRSALRRLASGRLPVAPPVEPQAVA